MRVPCPLAISLQHFTRFSDVKSASVWMLHVYRLLFSVLATPACNGGT